MTDKQRITIERDGNLPELFGITKATITDDGYVDLVEEYSESYIATDIESLKKIIEIYDNLRANQAVAGD